MHKIIYKIISRAAYANCQHMFHDVGLIQATYSSDTKFSSQLEFEEKCTEDAIEAGAEEVEDAEHVGKTVTVRFF